MIGFLGEYEATLDPKGRFLLPSGFKKQLPEDSSARFVINRGFEKCLSLYPIKSWSPRHILQRSYADAPRYSCSPAGKQ